MRVNLLGGTFLQINRALGRDIKLMTHSSTFDESTLVDKHKKKDLYPDPRRVLCPSMRSRSLFRGYHKEPREGGQRKDT